MTILKKVGYGFILCVVPYVTAIPLVPLMQTDLFFFKTIMIVEGTLEGGLLSALYLQRITRRSVSRCFIDICARNVAMGAPLVAIGYVLEQKSPQIRESTS
ncbi:hypothetical protein [Nitrospira defluvii]|uniref:Uncharacterized protein n=1 Tax=Nitrospira defluvii TaxID=330214 RepID=A0ABM8RMQ3_9BACT|nr:hypothetical protein [Nitrospira defluvii]CAE6761292.1 hypothetical protein NSPZN2_30658 [Nitrospira defluvii]